jgi:type II secretory pathway component PulJ
MRVLREQDGFSLIELLVSCTLMIIVLSATLGAFDVFGKNSSTNQQLTDAQDQARRGLDRMAWELRNATSYTVGAADTAGAVQRATPWDMIFKAVDPTTTPTSSGNANNVERVRYCLDTPTSTLWRQVQTLNSAAPPGAPSDTNCPGAGWTSKTVVATNVVNGGGRRAFTFDSQDSTDVNAPVPTLSDISSVRARLYVDPNPGKAPAETALSTGVFLRNENRRPSATCTATDMGGGHWFLNASASVDPEGGLLSYSWTDSGSAITQTAANFDYTPTAGSTDAFAVTVTDNTGLTAQATCTNQ